MTIYVNVDSPNPGGSSDKNHSVSYGPADRKGWPPPPPLTVRSRDVPSLKWVKKKGGKVILKKSLKTTEFTKANSQAKRRGGRPPPLLSDHKIYIIFLAVQNSSISDLVPCLVGLSGTTNKQSLHNITEWS